MNSTSKKLVLLSLAATVLTIGSMYADSENRGRDCIVGAWNFDIENPMNPDFPTLGSVRFDVDGTLTMPSSLGLVESCTVAVQGTFTTIGIGTWKRIGQRHYALLISNAIMGPDPVYEGALVAVSRLLTAAKVKLTKDGCRGEILNIEVKVFDGNDICFEGPFRKPFPVVQGRLCRLPCPQKPINCFPRQGDCR